MQTLIRPARAEEMDQIIGLAAIEGWNPGINDAAIFYSSDPSGFFVMETGGVLAGCISAVAYDDSFGFIGLYIMKPEYRGKGLGIQLWNHGMQYLGTRNIGLDGVVEQHENYKKSGFEFAYNNIRFQYINADDHQPDDMVFPLQMVSFRDIAAFDGRYFPALREGFLRQWIAQPGSIALGTKAGNELSGYLVIRECRNGYKAGPLFAKDPDTAKVLWEAGLSRLPAGAEVYLDIPEPNKDGLNLAQQYGMSKVFETARMYNRTQPKVELREIFGVTTFELG